MDNLFNAQLPVFQFIYKLVLTVLTGVLALICALPLLTLGPSLTALYDTVQKAIVQEQGSVLTTYFSSFRKNFRESFLCGLILLGYLLIVGTGTCFCVILSRETGQQTLLQYVVGALLLPALLILPYLFPFISRFVYTVREYLIYSFYLSIRNLADTLLFAVLLYGSIFLVCVMPSIRVIALALPGGICYLISIRMEKIFEPLMKKA